ncbi:MAG TPA: DUF2207 domain-containing protein [Longimicrobiales bacterium]
MTTRWRHGLPAALLLLAAAVSPLAAQKGAAPGGCAPENARTICYSRIEAEYAVSRRGHVDVTERYTVRFNGDWNGITRELIARATAHDFRDDRVREDDPDRSFRHVDIDVRGATDASGTPLRVEEERSGDDIQLRIWVPDARDAERTVVLRYRIHEGVTFFAKHDEFYWNVLGTTSTAPVARMDVHVLPPMGAAGVRAIANAGAFGTQSGNADVQASAERITATSLIPLGPGLGFTIVAGWDAGVVDRPGPLERALDAIARWWGLVLPLVSLVLMWKLWQRRGRDPAMLPIVTQYEPPAELTPGEVGTLLDERADMRDVTATLVDLAVQGRMRIEEVEGTKVFGMEFGEDYRFVDTAPGVSARPTKRHEALLHAALFEGAGSRELSDLKNEFYRDLPGIREAMLDALVDSGVYVSRPDRTRALWAVGAFVIGFALFGLLAFTGAGHITLIVVPPLAALPVLVFGWLMPRRTVKGTRTIERLRGFREFLTRVDGDRLRRMNVDPSSFERMLPYAMAFGVEQKWAEAFEGLAQQPPQWYRARHGGTFHPTVFVSDLGRMSTRTASMMSSRPSSSGSGGSGFSGGGSVGGGGGGGGVGGF